jgi:hypothetical protein
VGAIPCAVANECLAVKGSCVFDTRTSAIIYICINIDTNVSFTALESHPTRVLVVGVPS